MFREEQQLSLFPTRDSVAQVVAEAKAQLPITETNQLIALLQIYENTLLEQIKRDPHPSELEHPL